MVFDIRDVFEEREFSKKDKKRHAVKHLEKPWARICGTKVDGDLAELIKRNTSDRLGHLVPQV